jgi:hypothetical protein
MQKIGGILSIVIASIAIQTLPALAADGSIQPIYCKEGKGEDTTFNLFSDPFRPNNGLAHSDRYFRWDSSRQTADSRGGVQIKLNASSSFQRPFQRLEFTFNAGQRTTDDTTVNLCFLDPPLTFKQYTVALADPFNKGGFSLSRISGDWYTASLKNWIKEDLTKLSPNYQLTNFQIITRQRNGEERSFVLGSIAVNDGSFPDFDIRTDVLSCQTIYQCSPLGLNQLQLKTRLKDRLKKRLRP